MGNQSSISKSNTPSDTGVYHKDRYGYGEDVREAVEILIQSGSDESKTVLDLTGRGLTIPMLTALVDILERRSAYASLILASNKMTGTTAKALFGLLVDNTSIKYLSIAGNQIDDSCMESFAELLGKNNTLTHVSFGGAFLGNQISDAGLDILAKKFPEHCKLVDLDFAYNRRITDASMPSIKAILGSSTLSCIGINKTSITRAKPVEIACQESRIRSGITDFNISDHLIDDRDVDHICSIIKKHYLKITAVRIIRTSISLAGMKSIIREVITIPGLTLLDLNGNALDDECIEILEDMLIGNQTLVHLNLSDYSAKNKITDKGIEALCNALIGSTTIQHIDVSGYESITSASIEPFVELARQSSVTYLAALGAQFTQDMLNLAVKWTYEPLDKREIPLISKTKSAAKTHQ